MPAFNLRHAGSGTIHRTTKVKMGHTDEGILYLDRLSGSVHHRLTREEGKHIKEPLAETGLFRFHSSIVMGDGSALLLNKRGAEFLYHASDTDELKQRIGEEIWAPCGQRFRHQPEPMSERYFKGIIHDVRSTSYSSHNIVVKFPNGHFNTDVHISELRKTKPHRRGRGGHAGAVSGMTIWVAPFFTWDDPIKIDVDPSWVPGEKKQLPLHCKRVVEFTVPTEQEQTRLPWNNHPEGHSKRRKVFLLQLPKALDQEWDKRNADAEKQLKEHPEMKDTDTRKKVHSGPPKFFGDSQVAHYHANIVEMKPDGTLVIRWKNGYQIADYDSDDIPDEELEFVNYRRSLNGKPYNPHEFSTFPFYCNIDYERDGDPSYSEVIAMNDDGTFQTISNSRVKSMKHGKSHGWVISEKVEEPSTEHDIIHPLDDNDWGFRSSLSFSLGGTRSSKKEKKLHLWAGKEDLPEDLKDGSWNIRDQCKEDGGILAWMTWLHSPEENSVTERGTKVRSRNVSQFCLGSARSVVSATTTEVVPVIFKWDLPNDSERYTRSGSRDCCCWTEQTSITEDEVKGVPLLHAVYKKSLKEHGQEEGLGRVFAAHLMKFAEGRVEEEKQLDYEEDFSVAKRWKPQQEQLYLEIDLAIGEEEAFLARDMCDPRAMGCRWSWNHDILISANIRMEVRIIELEKELKKVVDKKGEKPVDVPERVKCRNTPEVLSSGMTEMDVQRMLHNETVAIYSRSCQLGWACSIVISSVVLEKIISGW